MARGKHEAPSGRHGQGKWWPLAAVCVAIFMLLIDITVVNVALPAIERDLGAQYSDLLWVIDAYALTLAAFLLTAGSLGDRVGRRAVFVVGIAIFALASLACGLSESPLMLSAFRAVQGVGGAIMFANSLALLAASYQGRDRGTAFGVWGAVTGASVAIGPLVGGALVSGVSWRWIFWVNLPIAAIAIAISLFRLPESRDPEARKVDYPGFVTFSGGLALLVFGLIRGNDYGWSSAQTLGEFGGFVVLMVLFWFIEMRHDDPMFDLSLFRRRAFNGAQVAAFAVSASMFSLFLYLTLYLQNVLGYSAFQTGVRLLSVSVMSLVVAPIAGKLSERVQFRILIGLGLAVLTAGLLAMTGLSASSNWTALLAGFVITGIGVGVVNAPLGSLAVGVVEPRRSGMASGINTTFRQVGIATGTAAFGAIFQSHIQSKIGGLLSAHHVPAAATRGVEQAVTSGAIGKVAPRVPDQFRGAFVHAARGAFTSGLDLLFYVAAGVAGIGALLAFVLIKQDQVVSSGRQARRPEESHPREEPADVVESRR